MISKIPHNLNASCLRLLLENPIESVEDFEDEEYTENGVHEYRLFAT